MLDAEEIGELLLLKVKYAHPDGKAKTGCTFEGVKIMVFQDKSLREAIRWKEIDPHFRKRNELCGIHKAPSPIARFPGDDDGWIDAKTFALGMKETK